MVLAMKASEQRRAAASGLAQEYLNHASPEDGVKQVLPARLGFPLELTNLAKTREAMTSAQLYDALLARGVRLDEIPFNYYRAETYAGRNRRLDNADCIKGKAPLYFDLAHFRDIYSDVQSLVSDMLAHYTARAEGSVLARMELEDLEKITQQQWKQAGWFLQSPICEQDVPDVYHNAELRKVVSTILSRVYVPKIGALLKEDMPRLIMQDDDPPDTMTGAPFFGAGDSTPTMRWLTLATAPPIRDVSPQEWVSRLLSTGESLGYPGATFYSPVVATRFGPLKKPTPLWERIDGGYQAMFSAVGVYNRIRFVYPAPYAVNFCLSPLYVQMSTARSKTLGLWHDPISQAAYLKRLQAQGKKPWSIDFSGMDTAMWKPVVLMIMEEMEKAGLARWPIQMFRELYPQMQLTLPSYFGLERSVTTFGGSKFPWCSGFKLTSEMDSLYGLSVLLSCLERQRPGILDCWCRGEFIICALGDDICFTTDFSIDADRLSEDALSLWGAKLKIQEDAIFLKWCLPIHREVPHLCRTFSRVIQQTFFNEDRYDGVDGGTRPDALMRLALQARLNGLAAHPDFAMWWPRLSGIMAKLGYLQTADASYMAGLRSAAPTLSAVDVRAIYEYSLRVPNHFMNLADRAKYEPSAAMLVRLAKSYGLNTPFGMSSQANRKWLLDALMSPPSSNTMREAADRASAFVLV